MTTASTIDLPDEARRQIEAAARRLGQTAEDFIAAALARLDAAEQAANYFQMRASRALAGTALALFQSGAGNEPPGPEDETS
jgi:hypothetical protein